MWFKYWESKGIPAPKFEINDLVCYVEDDPSNEENLMIVHGFFLKDNSWGYLLCLSDDLKGYCDEVQLKKA